MAVDLQIRLTEEAKAVVSRWTQAPEVLWKKVAAALDQENQRTVSYIKVNKLSSPGPMTLGVRTNRLRNSIWSAGALISSGGGLWSVIGSNVEYAGVHEFGFDGMVTVKQHQRRVPQRVIPGGNSVSVSMRQAARAGLLTKKGELREGAGTLTSGGVATVKEHQRHMVMPARAFIWNSLMERQGEYSKAINAAIIGAYKDPSK